MLKKIKSVIEKSLIKYLEVRVPSLQIKLTEKYPNHKYIWWFLYQIKEVSLFIFMVWIVWYISHFCNGEYICREYIELMGNTFKVN